MNKRATKCNLLGIEWRGHWMLVWRFMFLLYHSIFSTLLIWSISKKGEVIPSFSALSLRSELQTLHSISKEGEVNPRFFSSITSFWASNSSFNQQEGCGHSKFLSSITSFWASNFTFDQQEREGTTMRVESIPLYSHMFFKVSCCWVSFNFLKNKKNELKIEK